MRAMWKRKATRRQSTPLCSPTPAYMTRSSHLAVSPLSAASAARARKKAQLNGSFQLGNSIDPKHIQYSSLIQLRRPSLTGTLCSCRRRAKVERSERIAMRERTKLELKRDADAKELLREEYEVLCAERLSLTHPRYGPFPKGKAEPPVARPRHLSRPRRRSRPSAR